MIKKIKNLMTLRLSCLTSKLGITLAEVLIAVAIIGVVTVLILLPKIVSELQVRYWDSASENFQAKLTKALKIMNSQGTLAYHTSTEDFVNELNKNFKITNICKDKPSDCFNEVVFWGEQSLDMTKVKDNKSFGMTSWPQSEAIGVQFETGVTAILVYNKECIQNQYDKDTNVYECISMVYDTTAKMNPNENTKDIRTINVKRLLDAGL